MMQIPTTSRTQQKKHSLASNLLVSFAAIVAALPLAWLIYSASTIFSENAERSVMAIGLLLAVLFTLPVAAYILLWRQAFSVRQLSLVIIATTLIFLVAIYFFVASFIVKFPGDFLIWSESDFVNDILKFRIGYPLYTIQQNNESFTYGPGAQLLSYFLARLFFHPLSIPVYRAIQIVYTVLAALVAVMCTYRLIRLSSPDEAFQDRYFWAFIWGPFLLLVASNALTNPFVQNLHNDALAQLLSALCYLLLLFYVGNRDWRLLVPMVILPAAGLMVKQSLVIWIAIFSGYLLLFDQPRSFKRVTIYALASLGFSGLVFAGGLLLWGEPFYYWLFSVLGQHGISPLRAVQHTLDIWPYLFIGLFAGIVLLRGDRFRLLIGPWLIWLGLILLYSYTSGIAWMLNHIGPASLIAGVWFLAAIVQIWPVILRDDDTNNRFEIWLRAGIVVAGIILLFNGLQFVRIPQKSIPDDAYRYIEEIRAEFTNGATDKTLLDFGSFVYIDENIIMKDRAPTIGERGYSQTGDFSGILARIEAQQYDKILVRAYDAPDLWYDHYLWPESSGIKQKLDQYYVKINTISAVDDAERYGPYGFQEISVLVPKS